MPFQILEYVREDGHCPYGEWFGGLDPIAAAKVAVVTLRLEQGNLSNVKWFQGIGEFRLDWGPEYRIYFGRDGGNLIILLGGGTKKRQQKDVERAVAMWQEYLERKAGTK